LEKPARDKHSSLLQAFINYGLKKFYNIGSWEEKKLIFNLNENENLNKKDEFPASAARGQSYKTFYDRNL
jgi:hypothetical protein